VNRLDRAVVVPLDGVTKQNNRCSRCKRFARLWPRESACAQCSGVLSLEFVPCADGVLRAGDRL
jgi:predicted amidophosphoribosyltransferase